MTTLRRYDAVMVNWTNFDRCDGKDYYEERVVDTKACWSRLGADFSRRFRLERGLSLSPFSSGNFTKITEAGSDDPIDVPDWFEKVWAPVYFLRNRWDGLRYGRDRDSRW